MQRMVLAAVALLGAAACAKARTSDAVPPPPAAAVSTPAPRASQTGTPCPEVPDAGLHRLTRVDLDGDGAEDWIVEGYTGLDLFVARGRCAEPVGTIEAAGRFAFVHVSRDGDAGQMRAITIDTWLNHGDRARHVYRWSGSGYTLFKREKDIIEGKGP